MYLSSHTARVTGNTDFANRMKILLKKALRKGDRGSQQIAGVLRIVVESIQEVEKGEGCESGARVDDRHKQKKFL